MVWGKNIWIVQEGVGSRIWHARGGVGEVMDWRAGGTLQVHFYLDQRGEGKHRRKAHSPPISASAPPSPTLFLIHSHSPVSPFPPHHPQAERESRSAKGARTVHARTLSCAHLSRGTCRKSPDSPSLLPRSTKLSNVSTPLSRRQA